MISLSPKIINSIITQNHLNIKKNLGQNFLWDENVLTKIVDFSDISDNDIVLEVGPGLGSLTDLLLQKAKKVIAIEIDRGLCSILTEKYEKYTQFRLINADFLKITEKNALENLGLTDKDQVKCVANLPYYITSPIIMRLLTLPFVKEINIMVQKEVGSRIFAKPSTKDYGILTLAIQYYSTPIDKFEVSRNCFYPAPNVDSMVLKLNKNDNYYCLSKFTNDCQKDTLHTSNNNDNHYQNRAIDERFLFKVIRESFSQRRKKLLNSLSSSQEIKKEAIKASLKKMGFDENVRAENLTLENYITLSSLIAQK